MLRMFLLLLLLGSCHTCSKTHYGHLHGECCQRNRQPIRMGINCQDPRFHGNNWVFYDYILANPGNIRCCTTVTYCSHVDFRQTPISAAPHVTRDDFEITQKRLLWLGQCSAEHELIQQWISFHIYFHTKHIPGIVPKEGTMVKRTVDFFSEVSQIIHLRYPINLDRNIAWHASLIQYILISNIELYSSPGLANGIMQMLYISTLNLVEPKRSIVYSINIFKIFKDNRIPYTKGKLNTGIEIPFHSNICPRPHERINTLVTSDNRIDRKHWDPICMEIVNDSPYDNRVSWADITDKLAPKYALSLMRYEFHFLENLFPGIKTKKESDYRLDAGLKTHQKLAKQIPKDYIENYGNKTNCGV